MGCTNSSTAADTAVVRPPELSMSTTVIAADRHNGSARDGMGGRPVQQLSPNTSSRFRAASSFDKSAVQPTSKILSDLDVIMDYFKLPEILRCVLSEAEAAGQDVTDDVLTDCNNLFKKIPDDLVNALYPSGEMTASSVIRLASREHASDKFLEMIESTYKGTQRSAAGAENGRRLTLIYKNGTSRSLIFNEAWKYWAFIRAIKRSFRGVNMPVAFDCMWVRHNSVTPAAEKSFWGFGGGRASASDAVELCVEVANGMIWFTAGPSNREADGAPPETPVGDVLAISLASDFAPVRTMALEVNFLSHTWDPAAIGGSGESQLCIEVHHSGRPQEVPITFSDLGSRQYIYLKSDDLTSNEKIVLKVMTDSSKKSGELFELGKYDLKLSELTNLFKDAVDTAPLPTVGSPGSVDTFSDPAWHELRTLPSLTPFHTAVPSVPMVEHIILSVPDTRRMYRLVVHSALDVLGGEDDPQAAALRHKFNLYAVVELYSVHGELLSPANYHKTALNPSTLCPIWEAEFNFPLQVTDKEVASIVVKVKDGSGYLRHKTIGQVSVPTSVFVSVSEMALLRLPIDSTDINSGADVTDFPGFDMYGMLCVGTQTLPRDDAHIDKMYGGFVDSKLTTATKHTVEGPSPELLLKAAQQTEGKAPSRLLRQMSAAGQAVVSFCVRELSVCETCWPYETLYTTALDVTSGGAARRNSSATHPVISCSFGQGHLFAGADHLVTLPGTNFDNSLIRWCAELDPRSSLMEPVLRIPWSQIKEIDTITDSSLMITVILHRTSTERSKDDSALVAGGSSIPTQGLEKFRQYASTGVAIQGGKSGATAGDVCSVGRVTGAFEVDLLIAPCASVALARIVYERVELSSIRSNVKSFLKQYAVTMTPHKNVIPAHMQSFSSAADTLSLAKSIFKTIEQSFVASKAENINSIVCRDNKFTGNYSPADICLDLKSASIGAQSRGSGREFNIFKGLAYSPPYATEQSLQLRLKIMVTLLMDVCSALKTRLPGAQNTKQSIPDRVVEQLRLDESCAEEALFELEDSCAEKITKKMEFITEASLNTLREVVLCGWDGTYPYGIKTFSDALVAQTLKLLRRTLDQRLSDVAAFDMLDGISNKTTLVKYVLENNNYFCSSAFAILGVIGLSIERLPETVKGGSAPDEMLLLNKRQVENIVSIFSSTVISETKAWLAKTLNHYLQSKTNKFGLPWDVDTIGALSVSPIPETLRYQLNAYMSVCYDDTGNELVEHIDDTLSAAGVDMDARSFAMLTLNESVVKSIMLSLQLVAAEYKLALQCKHWEDASESNERASYLAYLVAVANDCYRINKVHIPDVLCIKTPDRSKQISLSIIDAGPSRVDMSAPVHRLVSGTTAAFVDASDGALRCIARVIFSDLLAVLIDFDSRWLDTHDEVYNLSSQSSAGVKLSRISKSFKTSVMGIIPGSQRSSGASPTKAANGIVDAVNPTETIIATLSDYCRDLRLILERDLFVQILEMCAHVCVVRYLVFLKRTAEQIQNNGLCLLTESFVSAIEADISTLKMFFSVSIKGEAMPQPTVGVYGLFYGADDDMKDMPVELKSKLDNFDKITVILRATAASDVKVQTALRELGGTYGEYAEGVLMVESLLRCCSALRQGGELPAPAPVVPASPARQGGIPGSTMEFSEQLLDAWGKQLSGVRRQIVSMGHTSMGASYLANDIYFSAFRVPSETSGRTSSGSGVKALRDKAASIALNIEKKNRDANTVGLLRSLGLLDPERVSLSTTFDAPAIVQGGGDQTPGNKRRFSATDSIKAAAAFLNSSNVGNNSNSIGVESGNLSGILETTVDSMSLSEICPSDTTTPVIDIMVFNIRARNVKGSCYVVATIGDNIPEQKTKVQKSSGDDPVWTDEVIFRGVDPKMLPRLALDIKVFDKGIRGKKLVGSAEVKLSVLDVRSVDSWFALDGGVAVGSTGEIHLSIMKRP